MHDAIHALQKISMVAKALLKSAWVAGRIPVWSCFKAAL